MSRSQAESTAILVAMLATSLISVAFYASFQLIYSTRLIARFMEIALGS